MPTNLPPEYFGAEKRFKEAVSPQEKIAALEELIATVPKHKGTDKLRADLRKKLAKLREEATSRKKTGKADIYSVERQGASQAVLAGFPNSGKSSLLAALTNAHPVIADYPVSTVIPLSGMMQYEDIQFQIVDLPPIGNESTDGWVSGILRTANILIFVVDLSESGPVQTELLFDQLSDWKILAESSGSPWSPEGKTKPLLIAANKLDAEGAERDLEELKQKYGAAFPIIGVSAFEKSGIEDLRQTIFGRSHVLRVYSKEPGKPPEMKTPFTLPEGSTVLDLAERIHKDFVHNLRYACIWGSAKFEGQRVQRDHVLKDRDIVEYHLR